MARPKKKDDDGDSGGEVKVKDFGQAVRLWRNDIKTALTAAATENQTVGEAYKAIKKQCHIQPQAAKLAFKLDGMEEAKRDDFLRCLAGLLKELNIPLEPADLVDAMQGQAPPRPKPKLVTIPDHPADDSDLADPSANAPQPGTAAAALAAMQASPEGASDAFEMSEDELAQQDGRGGES